MNNIWSAQKLTKTKHTQATDSDAQPADLPIHAHFLARDLTRSFSV